MAKCKHLNGDLIEVSDATHTRDVVNGAVAPDGYNNIQNITGYVFVCRDCGKRYEYRWRKSPKWLQRYVDALTDS